MSIENPEESDRSRASLRRRAVAPWLVAALLAVPGAARGPTAAEYDVKAAFLYNFTKFVEWPEAAFHDARSSFRVCVFGEDPFGDSLKTIAREGVGGRRLAFWRMDAMSDPSGCQILFVSRSESQRLPQILAAVRGTPVLTVGDTAGFLEKGGIINFVLEGSKVRFEVNQDMAEQAGLKISSKLLRLATRVVAGAHPGP